MVGAGGDAPDDHAVAELGVADAVAGVEAGGGGLGVPARAHARRRGLPGYPARRRGGPRVAAWGLVRLVPGPEARGDTLDGAAAEAPVGGPPAAPATVEGAEQLRGDVGEEARGRVGAAPSHGRPPVGPHEVEALLGAGDAHVGEAALLLHLVGVVEGAVVGKDALLHPRDEDDGKFQPLGLVEGDEGDGVRFFAEIVGVGDEGDLLEEGGQSLRRVHPRKLLGDAAELHDVLDALLAHIVAREKIVAVAGHLEDEGHELGGGDAPALLGEGVDELAEAGQRLHRTRGEVELGRRLGVGEGLDGGVEGEAPARRPAAQLVEGAAADPAGGDVDHPLQADVVDGVADEPQVGDDVLHLAALVEAGGPHQVVGEPVAHERLFEGAGLGVGAVEDGHVGVAPAFLAHQAADLAGGAGGLVVLVERVDDADPLAAPVLRPQPPVFLDHRPRRIEDRSCRAVRLVQADHRGAGIVLRETTDIPDIGVAPGVDRLVGVPDGEEVRLSALASRVGDEPGDAVLGGVGVLELVDHDVDVLAAEPFQDVLVALQQGDDAQEQVVEIEGVALGEQLLVALVDAVDDFVEVVGLFRCELLGAEEFGLRFRNRASDGPDPEALRVDF